MLHFDKYSLLVKCNRIYRDFIFEYSRITKTTLYLGISEMIYNSWFACARLARFHFKKRRFSVSPVSLAASSWRSCFCRWYCTVTSVSLPSLFGFTDFTPSIPMRFSALRMKPRFHRHKYSPGSCSPLLGKEGDTNRRVNLRWLSQAQVERLHEWKCLQDAPSGQKLNKIIFKIKQNIILTCLILKIILYNFSPKAIPEPLGKTPLQTSPRGESQRLLFSPPWKGGTGGGWWMEAQ